jgi:hypothetical protein
MTVPDHHPSCISHDQSASSKRASKDDGGFVLPWFALMLLVMVAMAGFGVDVWNWWYAGQQQQRAADAAALAGVPFMPTNFNATTPSATSTAIDAAARNGYTITAADVKPGPKANQLVVTIRSTTVNSFTGLLGARTTDVSRSATAEFNSPVQMGSPEAFLGCDPQNSCTAKHWLNIGAPRVDKVTGDRYADYGGSGGCTASWKCSGGVNEEYAPIADLKQDGYAYTIEVGATGGGQNVDVQVYDPEYANGGTSCDQNWGSGSQGTSNGLTPQQLIADYPDAATRYKTGTATTNNYCTGDDGTALGTPQPTVWIVRNWDDTPDDYTNNPIIKSGGPGAGGDCMKQFKGYNSNFADLLDTTSPGGGDADFKAAFHRWYTMCNITSTTASKKYFIQVRSNVPLQVDQSEANLTKKESPPEDNNLAGQNRYAIRVVTHNTNTPAPNIQVYAATHLPVYSNAGANGTTPNFYLARLLPGGGATGRVLQLRFFDIGDVGCVSGGAAGCGVSTVTITPPADATGSATSCTWTANNGGSLPGGTASGCVLSSIKTSNYNGVLVEVNIAVPGDYSCNYSSVLGCWFRLQMSYTSGTQANDTTTWDASIGGDPVRLIK